MATSTLNIETLESLGTARNGNSETQIEKPTKTKNWLMIIINCAFLSIGLVGGPLLMRLYYLHGGNRKWIPSCLQSAGFPILIFPLTFLYIQSKLSTESPSFWLEPKLSLWSAIIGILYGLINFMYSLGLSYIPVSTSSLLLATQLCFVAFFSWFGCDDTWISFAGYNTNGDRPVGVSKAQYLTGFLMTLGAAALAGLTMPLIELGFSKAVRNLNYSSLLQFQFIFCASATIFCVIGMLVNKDFQVIPREANDFELGKAMYYILMVLTAITWQLFNVGIVGVISYTSALFYGILTSVLVPFTGVAAVIFCHESFTGLKGMALALCLWGFCSYFYGEYKMMSKKVINNGTPETIVKDENKLNRLNDHGEP
ncbi:hypothetical protein C5167_008430 [Papaver somniferum]|uniref:Probable purine permease n=1 Tax=Papaver somniferum TaxID=3469 RepID=A0A4Y7JVK4_PAPSO|nr:hypothetical protein C5167_008430 [Papaver somniferum]